MDWRAIEAMTDRVVLDANGEMIRHVPFDDDGELDPSRPTREYKAILYSPDPDEIISFGRGFYSNLVSSQWAIAINWADVPDISFGKYDTFRALDRYGQPWFRYARVTTAASSSLIMVYLSPLGG